MRYSTSHSSVRETKNPIAAPRGHTQRFRTMASIYNVERDLVSPMQLVGMALGVVAPVTRTMQRSQEEPQHRAIARIHLRGFRVCLEWCHG